MKRIFLLILFILLLVDGFPVLGGANMGVIDKKIINHKIYVIQKITSDNMIELSNGSRINLLGVESKNNQQLFNLLEKMIGKKVIVEADDLDSGRNGYYLYLWGANHDDLLKFFDKTMFEHKGFLDANDSGNIKKGLAVFLNATLIKSGLAKTAANQQFGLRDQFLKWEKEAVQNMGQLP